MSYFARIAARASVGAGQPASSLALPAMSSRSPLVEHDQRLTLPGFAERALLSGQAPSSAPSAGFDSAEATPTTSAPVTVARKASSASFTPSAAALGLRTEAAREPASGSAALPARAVADPAPASVEPRLAAESPRAAALEPRASSPAALPSELTSASAPIVPTLPPSPARSIFEALTRADAWTRSAPRAASEAPASVTERAQEATADPRPSRPVMTPAVYAEAPEATIGAPGGPVLSIGRLEIEVVAPPRAEPASAPRRLERSQRAAARVPAPASFAAPRAYGWRQR